MKRNRKHPSVPPRRQRGVATLLIVLVVGLAVSVTVAATVYSLRGTQAKQLTTHSATAAQAAAWRGVEALRQYLLAANKEDNTVWESWQGAERRSVTMQGIGDIDGVITDVRWEDENAVWLVKAQVTGRAVANSTLATTATVDVVYGIDPTGNGTGTPGTEGGDPIASVITFNNDLNLSGSIAVKKEKDAKYQINVNGDMTTGGNTITGVDIIRATGSIRISSGSTFEVLESNGDVKFDGSVTVTKAVQARGNVCVEGGANAAGATLKANGSVTANGGVMLGDVQAIGRSDRADGITAMCVSVALDADGNPYAIDLQGNAGARTAKAEGSIRINSGSIITADGVRTGAHFYDANCGGSESGLAGKSVGGTGGCNPPAWNGVVLQPGVQVPVSPVSPVVLDTTKFNAYTQEKNANYVFKVNSSGYRLVTVRSVNGITDGTYFIGDYDNNAETGWSRGYKDFMCSELAANSTPAAPRCKAPVRDPPGAVCSGYSSYNACLSYDAASRKWTLAGTSALPGVMWFEGGLHLNNGTYYNTFLATENFSMGGGVKVYAMNYAGYDGMRMVGGTPKTYAPTGICVNSAFPGRYPTNYCDTVAGTYAPPGDGVLGNYALLAGSYNAQNQYMGGNIALGSSAEIFGSVLAGNMYTSGGSTTIHGTITALSLGSQGHAAGGSTTLDLTDLPAGYIPTIKPCHLEGTCPTIPTSGENGKVEVYWSRYL